jgi:predicted membrane metal-binding protein
MKDYSHSLILIWYQSRNTTGIRLTPIPESMHFIPIYSNIYSLFLPLFYSNLSIPESLFFLCCTLLISDSLSFLFLYASLLSDLNQSDQDPVKKQSRSLSSSSQIKMRIKLLSAIDSVCAFQALIDWRTTDRATLAIPPLRSSNHESPAFYPSIALYFPFSDK